MCMWSGATPHQKLVQFAPVVSRKTTDSTLQTKSDQSTAPESICTHTRLLSLLYWRSPLQTAQFPSEQQQSGHRMVKAMGPATHVRNLWCWGWCALTKEGV